MLVREVPIPKRMSTGGWLARVAIVLVLVITAVPALLEPTGTRCRKSEEALQLNKIGKRARTYFVETGAFPTGRSQTMPPWSCCPNACGVVPRQGWLADPMWAALGYSIDETTQVQYSYESVDGKTFRATAVRDVNCSGDRRTYVLEGSSLNGNPSVSLIEPEPAPR